jgi:hypothetical protein
VKDGAEHYDKKGMNLCYAWHVTRGDIEYHSLRLLGAKVEAIFPSRNTCSQPDEVGHMSLWSRDLASPNLRFLASHLQTHSP